MQIVLYEPQIPQNTGNIARTCAVTGTSLRLFRPGFKPEESKLKRAGLDYWRLLDVAMIEDFDAWLEEQSSKCIFFSSHAKQRYSEVSYSQDSILVFGSETRGLPAIVHERFSLQTVRLPMRPFEQARCLNLATSVGIGLYEALRQTGFSDIT